MRGRGDFKILCGMFAILALAAITPRALAQDAGSGADNAPVYARPSDDPNLVAKRVFEGSRFWWKHRGQVDDPTRGLGFFDRLGRLIGDFFSAIGDVLKRLIEWLLHLFIRRPSLGNWADAGRNVVWIALALAIGVAAWFTVRWLRLRNQGNDHRGAADDPWQPEKLPDALVLLARARSALAAGQNAESLRLAFLGILAALQQQGLLRYDRARTNREYHRDLGRQPDLAADFHGVVVPFEGVRYGHARPERGEAERVIAVAERLALQGAAAR